MTHADSPTPGLEDFVTLQAEGVTEQPPAARS